MSVDLAPTPAPSRRRDRPDARSQTRRRTKGTAIAAIAAGTALLLGGTGTLAVWSTQTALTAGPIESGNLDLLLDTTEGVWTLQGLVGGLLTLDPASISAVRIVPGDVLTLTQPLEVVLEGDTLAADLSLSSTDVVGGALAPYVDVDLSVTGLGSAVDDTYRITPDTDGELTATVTITFDPATTGQLGANTTLDLSNLVFSLTQVAD